MAFFRIKKIKGNEYAYRFENEWKKGTSVQKVKGYLGLVFRFEKSQQIEFQKFINIEDLNEYTSSNDWMKIIKSLVEWEIYQHSIDRTKFNIDLNSFKVQRRKRNSVFAINEGYMCNLTLSNLANFKKEDESVDGFRLARVFIEAGVKVPQDAFVGIYGKLYKTEE